MLLSSYLVYSQQPQAYRQGLFSLILFPRLYVPNDLFLLGILLSIMLPYGLFAEFSVTLPTGRKSLPRSLKPVAPPIVDRRRATRRGRLAEAAQ